MIPAASAWQRKIFSNVESNVSCMAVFATQDTKHKSYLELPSSLKKGTHCNLMVMQDQKKYL